MDGLEQIRLGFSSINYRNITLTTSDQTPEDKNHGAKIESQEKLH